MMAKYMWRSLKIALLLGVPMAAPAGDFSVSPIRLELQRGAKTGAVTVNNDATAPLNLQVKLAAWSQDAVGKDVYEDSNDLTYFPRLIKLAPQKQQLVRVGLRIPARDSEKTYRLFLEEIPEPLKPDQTRVAAAAIAVAIRFGVPIFVKPPQETIRGAITSLTMLDNALIVKVQNTGNVHFIIEALTATRASFKKSIQGWYLLPGITRDYTIPLDTDGCQAVGAVQVSVKTNRLELSETMPANQVKCVKTTGTPDTPSVESALSDKTTTPSKVKRGRRAR